MEKWTFYWWAPLFIGCLIYILFRTDTLLYNKLLGKLFTPIASPNTFLQRILVFSLPDGLWAMSYTMLIFHVRNDKTLKTLIWSIIIPVVGILSEISQYYSLIPGTFDIIDLIMYFIFPIFVIKLVL